MTATAYDRILGRLRSNGNKVRQTRSGQAYAQCPAHEDRNASLSITDKGGRVMVWDHGGCDTRDVAAALGMPLRDLWDNPRESREPYRPDPQAQARIEARRNMTRVQRALDDLLQLPDIGERFARSIIWHDNAQRLGGRNDGAA